MRVAQPQKASLGPVAIRGAATVKFKASVLKKNAQKPPDPQADKDTSLASLKSIPDVFIRLYLNLQSKKFKRNAKVVEAKRADNLFKKSLHGRDFKSHVKPKRNAGRQPENLATMEWTSGELGLCRLIRFDSADKCRTFKFEDEETRSARSTGTGSPDYFSQIEEDLSSAVKTERVSFFNREGVTKQFACFYESDMAILEEHSVVPRLVD